MHFAKSCLFKLLEELIIFVVIFALISCTFIGFHNIINLFKFFYGKLNLRHVFRRRKLKQIQLQH